MSNIEAANALLTAINLDRFAEIQARHNPDVVFHSFRGPTLRDSVAVGDWYRTFLRDYADCNYAEVEHLEDGDAVAVHATIEAKGYDFRPFTQRVVDLLDFEEGGVAARRLYAMLPDLVLEKASTAALANATGYRGGSVSTTRQAVQGFFAALLQGDGEKAASFLDPKAVLIDSVYGQAAGPENILALLGAMPNPAFGSWRATRYLCGAKTALVELAIDSSRPRAADWVRVVDGKIAVIESYWMLREIGVDPSVARRERYIKQVIFPT